MKLFRVKLFWDFPYDLLRLFIFVQFLFSFSAYANTKEYLYSVGEAKLVKENVLIYPFINNTKESKNVDLLKRVQEIILKDFNFYLNYFNFKIGKVLDKSEVNLEDSSILNNKKLIEKKINFFVKVKVSKKEGEILVFELYMYALQKQQVKKISVKTDGKNIRNIAHTISDKIYEFMTNTRSIFLSKIIFASDYGSTEDNFFREIYIQDFDGHNVKRLTHHFSLAISPAISFDQKKIVYSLIEKKGTRSYNFLYMKDLEKNEVKILSLKKGVNSGAVFLDNDNVIYTTTETGNAEIYKLNINTRKRKKLTHHYSDDVDPSISANGQNLTFLSTRSGIASIFLKDLTKNSKPKRISFVGRFNATPRFSPDGEEIAFASWMDNQFELFRINVKGGNLVRLTKGFGSSESPSYSNDGNFIAFTGLKVRSKRRADQRIYIIDRFGNFIKNICEDIGNCVSPRWTR